MLVKELRQGVRTRVFVTLFILLQVVMLLDLSLSLLNASDTRSTAEGTILFWVIVGVPILVILPFNALGAINHEIRGNTLELIFLTRLTALRIVVGKWLAIFAQTLLMVCAVLPYLVLRYFIGGVNITNELLTLGVLLAASALLAGIATGISAYPARVVRTLLGAAGVGGFFAAVNFFNGVGRRTATTGPGGGSVPGTPEIVGVICGAILILYLMLEVGAAKIAPPAENHSAPIRLMALAGLALAWVESLLVRFSTPFTLAALVIAMAVCAVAVCEEPRAIPGIYRSFTRWGWPGRLAGRLLYPGWATGLLFTLVVFAASGSLLVREKLLDTTVRWVEFTALAGALLLPVALIRSCLPNTRRALIYFFAVQIVCSVVAFVASMCDNILKTHAFGQVCSVLPLSALLMSAGESSEVEKYLWPVLVVTLLSLAVALAVLFRPLRQIRRLEKESLQSPEPPASHAHGSLA